MIKLGRQLAKFRQTLLPAVKTTSFVNRINYLFAQKTFPLPQIADSITEGTIAQFNKKEGDWVEMDQTVANVETDKVTVQIKSPAAGILTKFYVKKGDTLAVGKNMFAVDVDAKKPTGSAKTEEPAQKKKQSKTEQSPNPPNYGGSKQAPLQTPKSDKPQQSQKEAKQTPKQQPKQTQKQVQKQASKQEAKESQKQEQKLQTQSTPSAARNETREPMSRLRQRVSQRLKEAQNTFALLTTFQEVDMYEATNTRKQIGEDFMKKYNVKLGFMSFFLKAATLALQEYPIVNSVIDGNNIVKRNFIDISVAVATPTGLMVPVLRNCQNMKFHDFEIGLAQLAKKGKENKITLEDLQGGTFTISNGGTFGSLMGTPIINPPQSAILGMHAIINRPVVRGDEIVARPMMYLALTYDHRLLDGKDAVLFLKRIQTLVQNPKRMLFQI